MINIDLLSKYRAELMGLSILLIMLFHSSFVLSNGLALHTEHTILDALTGGGNLLIFKILDIGVDFFFYHIRLWVVSVSYKVLECKTVLYKKVC